MTRHIAFGHDRGYEREQRQRGQTAVAAPGRPYFGVDVNLVRLGFGVFTVFYGLGILAYLIAWVILPEEGEDHSILETFVNRL
jgi:hypothetical protein